MMLPEIDDHEARNLEMVFQGFTDKDLIRELVRRKRLHVVSAFQFYFDEHKADDVYMQHIESDIASMIVRHVVREGHVNFNDAPAPGSARSARRGAICVLREKTYVPTDQEV